MTEKRLNEAMQANLPEAPKGFDERIDQMALDLAAGQARGVKGTRGLRTGLILAMVTVLLLGTFTAFAATNERVNTWLYEFWPEAATALMPANTSSVKEGIRLELVSAEVQDGTGRRTDDGILPGGPGGGPDRAGHDGGRHDGMGICGVPVRRGTEEADPDLEYGV